MKSPPISPSSASPIIRHLVIYLISSVFLAGFVMSCGGGDGGGSQPPPPPTTPTGTPTTWSTELIISVNGLDSSFVTSTNFYLLTWFIGTTPTLGANSSRTSPGTFIDNDTWEIRFLPYPLTASNNVIHFTVARIMGSASETWTSGDFTIAPGTTTARITLNPSFSIPLPPQPTTPPTTSFTISLTTSNTIVPTGTTVTLTATANQDVGPTPFFIFIFEGTQELVHCATGTECSATVTETSAVTKSYVARVARSDGTDVQATSSTVSVTWSGGTPPAESPTVVQATSDSNGDVKVKLDSGDNLIFHLQDQNGGSVAGMEAFVYKGSDGATIIAWDPLERWRMTVYSTPTFSIHNVTIEPFRPDAILTSQSQVIPNHLDNIPAHSTKWEKFDGTIQQIFDTYEWLSTVKDSFTIVHDYIWRGTFNPLLLLENLVWYDIKSLYDLGYYLNSPTEKHRAYILAEQRRAIISGQTTPITAFVDFRVISDTGDGIPEAKISLSCPIPPFAVVPVTGHNGWTRIQNLSPGICTVSISRSGYKTTTTNFTVASTLEPQVVVVTMELNAFYKIVLTWGREPRDLDTHLWTPSIEGTSYHIFTELLPGGDFGSLDSPPFTQLDTDEINGFGPEALTIVTLSPGTYTYAIHKYAGTGSLKSSSAVVRVFDQAERVINSIPIPTIGEGEWWHVFNIDGGSQNIQLINIIQSSPPR